MTEMTYLVGWFTEGNYIDGNIAVGVGVSVGQGADEGDDVPADDDEGDDDEASPDILAASLAPLSTSGDDDNRARFAGTPTISPVDSVSSSTPSDSDASPCPGASGSKRR